MPSLSPDISVVMSVYDCSPDYLRASVDSIQNQTFSNFEFIIIDDCSQDESWAILTDYAIRDRRIRLLRNRQNMGLTKSLNRGLHLAQGNYIARQDADDISLPTRFEKQAAWLESHPETVLISSEIQRIRPDGSFGKVTTRACPTDFLPWHLIFYNHLGGHSQVMFRRQPVIDLGGYNETYRYSQDYELWCRLAQIGQLAILPEILLNQRFHNASVSANKQSEQSVLVLNQVTRNIERLTGKTPPLSEVENLHRLWSTEQDSSVYRFPEPGLAHQLNSWLDILYKAYIIQSGEVVHSLPKQALRALIGQKFFIWASKLSLSKQLSAKLQLYLLALRWAPRQTLKPRFTSKMTMSTRWEAANG